MRPLADLTWFKSHNFVEAVTKIYSRSPKQLGCMIDHMELLAICLIDKKISTGEILNIRDDEAAFDGTEEAVEELDTTQYPNVISDESMKILIKDRLEYRRSNWAEVWPFELEVSDRGYCTLKFNSAHPFSVHYIYLLLTLYAKYIEGGNDYRNFFEECCYHLAKRLFPEDSGWIVKQTGAAAVGSNAYTGNNHKKLQGISTDLNLSNRPPKRIASSSGDSGIDLIAFHQLYDQRGCLPVVFMQCACSADIDKLENKTWDACYTRLQSFLNLDIMHEWFVFSPYDWFDSMQPNRFVVSNNHAVVFDRGRILKSIYKLGIQITLTQSISDQIKEFINAKGSFH